MNIAVFGLGYVGCVTAACFARENHHVIGVDISAPKVESIQQGKSPIIEPGLSDLIQDQVSQGRLQATSDAETAVNSADIIIICVGTPSERNGSLNIRYVEKVCRDIGRSLRNKKEYAVVVIRSTILPGKANETFLQILESESGKKAGEGFGFCVNPEFLREGSAIADFDAPPYTVISQLDDKSGDHLAQLYANIDAPVHRLPLGAAEMVKYASNTFHALKVAFANEIGNLCKAYGIDSHAVMDVFVQDTKLNLSPYYLKPGFSFGGSCLPKDLRALLYAAQQADVTVPVLEGVLPSNTLQTKKALEMVMQTNARSVGLVGLSFKANTDDLRESPAIELAERLIGKGYNLHIYDREVALSRLHGSNRRYIDEVIPHISSLMRPSLVETLSVAELVIISKKPSPQEYEVLCQQLRPDQTVIDLVRLDAPLLEAFQGRYHGICW